MLKADVSEARRRGVMVVLVITIATGGCRHEAGRATSSVVDSAGIEIATNPPGSVDGAEEWSLSATPAVSIGSGDDPEVTLFRVTSVTPLADGRVAVGSSSPAEVRLFDEGGRPLGSVGGPGSGPGEFSTVQSVVEFGGDSLAVWDPNRRRISVFDRDGAFQREVALVAQVMPSLETAGGSTQTSGWTYLLPATAGSVDVFAVGFFGPGTGMHRAEAMSYRFDMEGREVARFGPFPGAESFLGEQVGFLPLPFGKRTYGATVAGALVVGTAEEPEVRVYSAGGALERISRWPDHERTVTGPLVAQWEAWLGEQLSAMPEAQRRDMRAAFDALPHPAQFPAYADIVAADSSEFWVGEYAGQLGLLGLPSEVPPPPARRWLVFDIRGLLVGKVETPAGFDPHVVRRNRVWGVHKDEYLVESVRAYELTRGF